MLWLETQNRVRVMNRSTGLGRAETERLDCAGAGATCFMRVFGKCRTWGTFDLQTQEKIPKIQSLFYLVFPWIHQYPCSDESQVWIEPGFFLDYFVQYRKSVIFPALDIKKQASTWIFRKPRGCTLFYLLSRFGKSVWITKYPDWQTPNLDNLLAKTGFFLNPNLDKSKNNSGI